MRRRQFVFRSLAASMLLSPLLRARTTRGQAVPRRALIWVNSSAYPRPEHFFPARGGRDFTLPEILEPLEPLRDDLVIVDGVDVRRGNPTGTTSHVYTMGKVLTSALALDAGRGDDLDIGGPSIDHLIAEARGFRALELRVGTGTHRHRMRTCPFGSGPRRFKMPTLSPAEAWDRTFRDVATDPADDTGGAARRHRLLARRSILDQMTGELGRVRAELVGSERLELDVLEDSIRRAEMSVAEDLELATLTCAAPERPGDRDTIPLRAMAHFDVLFAAFACDRVQMAGMVWGRSGYNWGYGWLPEVDVGTIHDDVHHPPRGTDRKTPKHIRSAQWDWEQLGGFAQRLRGAGMLDETLILGISHFGVHHEREQIPFVLIGNAAGQLETGRCIKLPERVNNDQALVSFAHLMGVPLEGLGQDERCGPLDALFAL